MEKLKNRIVAELEYWKNRQDDGHARHRAAGTDICGCPNCRYREGRISTLCWVLSRMEELDG